MSKVLKITKDWIPLVLSIWLIVTIATEDYVKATYLIAFVGVLLITKQLERIAGNTDLTNVNIRVSRKSVKSHDD